MRWNRLASWLAAFVAFLISLPMLAQDEAGRAGVSRYRTNALSFGVGAHKALDTYLSPLEYAGIEVSVANEMMRFTRFSPKISVQSFFRVSAAHLDKSGSKMEYALVNWNYGLHYQFKPASGLKLLAGGLVDMNAGVLYNPRNSNNPASARAFVDFDLSGMAIYKFRIKKKHLTARYQINMPVVGVMYMPDYGASYYEMFYLGNRRHIVSATSFHNHFSLRQQVTLDFPIRYVTLRVGYYWEMEQAKVNSIKVHDYSHSFTVGFVRAMKFHRDRHGKPLPPVVNAY